MTQLASWILESARTTAFTDDEKRLGFDWIKLVGAPPTEQVRRPAEGVERDIGALGAARLIVGTQLGRVDILMRVPPEIERAPTPDIPNLGPFPETMLEFASLSTRWVADAEPIKRLALGIVILCPFKTEEDGISVLRRALPRVEVPEEAPFDFLFQVNRRRDAQVAGSRVTLNRMMKWQMMELQLFLVQPHQRPLVSQPTTGAIRRIVRLELDLSTPADRVQPIPRDERIAIFQALFENAKDIANRGDVV